MNHNTSEFECSCILNYINSVPIMHIIIKLLHHIHTFIDNTVLWLIDNLQAGTVDDLEEE